MDTTTDFPSFIHYLLPNCLLLLFQLSLTYSQLAFLCFPEFLSDIFYSTLAPQHFLSHTCSPTFSIPCSLISHHTRLSPIRLSLIISYPPILYPATPNLANLQHACLISAHLTASPMSTNLSTMTCLTLTSKYISSYSALMIES